MANCALQNYWNIISLSGIYSALESFVIRESNERMAYQQEYGCLN
jgi:hypothetical protein